jgi:hypothetical protein
MPLMENCKMIRRIADIPFVRYVNTDTNGVNILCEPTREDIQLAINNKEHEQRGFQSHLNELEAEWGKNVKNGQEWNERIRVYHTRRIAHFIVHGWIDPIILNADGTMKDGLHRLKAAIFMGKDEIDVIISDGDSK